MSFRGRVRGGVVVLDDGVRLPEGAAVLVSLVEPRDDDEVLRALEEWYSRQHNGEWEHTYGIEIKTLDNPGWLVKIDLMKTELQTLSFQPIEESVDSAGHPLADSWFSCSVKDAVWRGAGDQTKLAMILRTFLDWANRSVG